MTPPTLDAETRATEDRTHHTPWTRYLLVWIALLLLTGSTFLLSLLLKRPGFPPWLHFATAIGIACVKVSLVVMFFMHLKDAEGANRLVFGTSIFFVGLLMFFVLADIKTRFQPLTRPHPVWMHSPKLEEPRAGPEAQGGAEPQRP